ncbi:MAG: excinuclease ABC subunit B [Tenericutes bacterium ADurb.BinA155]|jgi:competence protein ComFA|nr:MAG: excinuclease ABC subunit B [Tenericutes bacterium ADurb.BinA155]
METSFVCPRCGNRDPRYIGHKNGQPYCRKCIGFRGENASGVSSGPKNVILDLQYHLSKEQEKLSAKIIQNYKNGDDTLVYAVCGSGKTEISYGIIAYAMSRGLHVGFALPRRDVCIELFFRLKSAFPHNRIVAVYGQHTSTLEADCIILTTHQLYRYPNYFDLLVMDEIDAFPFKGNEVLIALFKRSLRGHCVMMSATPSQQIKAEFHKPHHQILELHTRFHKHPIPVPKNVIRLGFLKYFFLIQKLKEYQKKGKPCFIFVPTIALAESVFSVLSLFVPHGNYVSSQREHRAEIIQAFREKKYAYLVTTAVLERGVTIRDIQVIIYEADHKIYDSAALIQISGRAGRKSDAPDGEVVFLANQVTRSMEKAIREIRFCNSFL